MIYFLFKAFHLIAIVAWFSAMLYLPRIFVYHTEEKNKEARQTLERMAGRLYKIIMTPAVMAVFITGFLVLWVNPGVFGEIWFQIKFALVLLLLAYHVTAGRFLRAIVAGKNTHSARFYRFFNEIPAVFLVVIVILAFVKPF